MESKIMRLLQSHLRILPYGVTIAYPFGSSRLLTKDNLQTKIKPLSDDSVRGIRRQKPTRREEQDLNPQHANMSSRHIYR
jgi:hypothetical protein